MTNAYEFYINQLAMFEVNHILNGKPPKYELAFSLGILGGYNSCWVWDDRLTADELKKLWAYEDRLTKDLIKKHLNYDII